MKPEAGDGSNPNLIIADVNAQYASDTVLRAIFEMCSCCQDAG
ncbi:hypothetical protein [Novosphingobium sp.]|nr:hypothetical protein [Novosphingobium sp.]